MQEITVLELKRKLDEQQNMVLIDVREPDERAVSHIGGMHIPLSTLPAEVPNLEKYRSTEIIIYCRSGSRSASAVAYLSQIGFQKVYNLKGGMKAWKQEIDPSIEVA